MVATVSWFSLQSFIFSICSKLLHKGGILSKHTLGARMGNALDKSPVNERADSARQAQTPTCVHQCHVYHSLVSTPPDIHPFWAEAGTQSTPQQN